MSPKNLIPAPFYSPFLTYHASIMPNLFLFLVQLLPTSEFLPMLIQFFSFAHHLAEFLSVWDSKEYSDSPCVRVGFCGFFFFSSYLTAIVSFSRLSSFEILHCVNHSVKLFIEYFLLPFIWTHCRALLLYSFNLSIYMWLALQKET